MLATVSLLEVRGHLSKVGSLISAATVYIPGCLVSNSLGSTPIFLQEGALQMHAPGPSFWWILEIDFSSSGLHR